MNKVKFHSIQEKTNGMAGTRHLKTNYHKKMVPRWEGPFKIEEVLGPVTYQLKLPESWKIHKVFYTTLLHPYKENEIYGENYPWPLLDVENKEEVYKVEQVLKHQRRRQGYKYLVKWAGYPITEASWEPKSSFTGWQGSYKNTKNATSCKATCLSSERQNQLPISTGQGNTSLMTSLRNASSWKTSLKTWSENIYICFNLTNIFDAPL